MDRNRTEDRIKDGVGTIREKTGEFLTDEQHDAPREEGQVEGVEGKAQDTWDQSEGWADETGDAADQAHR